MKEKLAILSAILVLVLVLGWALNSALSYYDPPTGKRVEYKVPRNMYLWQVASELSNQFRKHPGTLADVIYKENDLSDNYLPAGKVILIPGK